MGIILFMSANVFAAPFQKTGWMVDIPEAFPLKHTEGQFGESMSTYLFLSEDTNERDYDFDGRLNVGILNWLTLGMTAYNENYVAGHIQLTIPFFNELSGYPLLPVIALGMENLSADKYLTPEAQLSQEKENYSLYGVMSKSLKPVWDIPLDIHLGYGNNRFEGKNEISDRFQGLFMGIRLHASDSFRLLLEQDGRDVNFGMTFDLTRRVSGGVAWTRIEDMFKAKAGEDPFIYFQSGLSITYRFGPFGMSEEEQALYDRIKQEQKRTDELQQRLLDLQERRRKAEAELKRLEEEAQQQKNE